MVVMSYVIVGLLSFVTYVSAGDADDMLSCLQLFDPEGEDKMCCKSMESFENISKDYEECLKEESEDWLCEDFQCILKKIGMFKDNKIDEEGAKKVYDKLESDYPNEKSLIQRVRRECLDGKYQNYPPEDACPAVKFYICSYINIYVDCDSWKDIDVCTNMAQNAKKCKAALGN